MGKGLCAYEHVQSEEEDIGCQVLSISTLIIWGTLSYWLTDSLLL